MFWTSVWQRHPRHVVDESATQDPSRCIGAAVTHLQRNPSPVWDLICQTDTACRSWSQRYGGMQTQPALAQVHARRVQGHPTQVWKPHLDRLLRLNPRGSAQVGVRLEGNDQVGEAVCQTLPLMAPGKRGSHARHPPGWTGMMGVTRIAHPTANPLPRGRRACGVPGKCSGTGSCLSPRWGKVCPGRRVFPMGAIRAAPGACRMPGNPRPNRAPPALNPRRNRAHPQQSPVHPDTGPPVTAWQEVEDGQGGRVCPHSPGPSQR